MASIQTDLRTFDSEPEFLEVLNYNIRVLECRMKAQDETEVTQTLAVGVVEAVHECKLTEEEKDEFWRSIHPKRRVQNEDDELYCSKE